MRVFQSALLLAAAAVVGLNSQWSRADVPGLSMTGYTYNAANHVAFSVGYTFTISQPIVITALGTMDFGGTSIASVGPTPVALYYSAVLPNLGTTTDGVHTSGTPVAGASVSVTSSDPILSVTGGTYTPGSDGFRYHMLDTPISLYATTYEIMSAELGAGFTENWFGISNFAGLTGPQNAVFSGTQKSTADYETNLAPSSVTPGLAGGNFLIQTPEPTAIGVVAILGLGLIRRR